MPNLSHSSFVRGPVLGAIAVVGAVFYSAPAWAQDDSSGPAAPRQPSPAPATAGDEPVDEPKEKKKKKKKRFRAAGRVFAGHEVNRTTIGGEDSWRSGLQLNSARVGLIYQEGDFLRAEVKLDAKSGRGTVRDAYMSLEPDSGFELHAGRFKRPLSILYDASRWDLPMIERGLLSESVEGQGLDIVGSRGIGVMAAYRLPVAANPRVSLSAFESEGIGGVIDATENYSQDLYLKVSIEPVKDLQIASTFAYIGFLEEFGRTESYDHAPLASLEIGYTGSYLHAWAEGYFGKSRFARLMDPASGDFAAGRAYIAPRFRPGVPRRLVPYIGGSYFDPRLRQSGNSNTEAQGGINFAFSKTWRFQVEVAHVIAEGASSFELDRTSFRLQLATRYKD